MIRLGVTGTDTGVGKTVVTCALAAALRRRGLTVAAMKPVESGVEFDDPHRDGARLARAAGDQRPLSLTAPITFHDAFAPLVASRRERRTIDLDRLDAAMRDAAKGHDVLLVEGAGGLLVRYDEDGTTLADLARELGAPALVVADPRLGTLNHTALTLESMALRGVELAGVVLGSWPYPGTAAEAGPFEGVCHRSAGRCGPLR